MSGSLSLGDAVERLSAALARLEDAVEHRSERERAAAHATEVQALSDDRSRLAKELDASFARAERLESANRDVSRRLDQAIDAIRLTLAPPDPR